MIIKKNILIQTYIIIFISIFLSGCRENPLSEVSVFSGSWKIIMSNSASVPVMEARILINDYGNFTDKVIIYPVNDTSIIIQGTLNIYGDIVAVFKDRNGGNPSGSLTGSITETAGITFGSGTWNDTLRTPDATGKWTARRY